MSTAYHHLPTSMPNLSARMSKTMPFSLPNRMPSNVLKPCPKPCPQCESRALGSHSAPNNAQYDIPQLPYNINVLSEQNPQYPHYTATNKRERHMHGISRTVSHSGKEPSLSTNSSGVMDSKSKKRKDGFFTRLRSKFHKGPVANGMGSWDNSFGNRMQNKSAIHPIIRFNPGPPGQVLHVSYQLSVLGNEMKRTTNNASTTPQPTLQQPTLQSTLQQPNHTRSFIHFNQPNQPNQPIIPSTPPQPQPSVSQPPPTANQTQLMGNQPQLPGSQTNVPWNQPQPTGNLPQPCVCQPLPPQLPVNQPQTPGNQSLPSGNKPLPSGNQSQPPLGQSQPPLGQPQPPLGQYQPPLGRPQPSLGQSQPQLGQPQPLMGQPQPPMGQAQTTVFAPSPSGNQPQTTKFQASMLPTIQCSSTSPTTTTQTQCQTKQVTTCNNSSGQTISPTSQGALSSIPSLFRKIGIPQYQPNNMGRQGSQLLKYQPNNPSESHVDSKLRQNQNNPFTAPVEQRPQGVGRLPDQVWQPAAKIENPWKQPPKQINWTPMGGTQGQSFSQTYVNQSQFYPNQVLHTTHLRIQPNIPSPSHTMGHNVAHRIGNPYHVVNRFPRTSFKWSKRHKTMVKNSNIPTMPSLRTRGTRKVKWPLNLYSVYENIARVRRYLQNREKRRSLKL
uniref:41 kDa spicule matrix protein n=1 Tax=Lygus hesperus TaxID=30085 RepID=A0A0A9Z1D0_LYGHE